MPPGVSVHDPQQIQRQRGEGVQDVQGGDREAVRADPAAALPHPLHQALHQEHLLRREEPHHRQLPDQGDGHDEGCGWVGLSVPLRSINSPLSCGKWAPFLFKYIGFPLALPAHITRMACARKQ